MKLPCSFTDCDRPAKGHGLCSTHLLQMKRYGETFPIGSRRAVPKPCSYEGCERRAHGQGLCNAHWQQVRAGRETGPLEPRYKLAEGIFRCGRCGEEKLAIMFSPVGTGRTRRHECKACHAAYMRKWHTKNPKSQRLYRVRKFGLTAESYDALFAAQNGRCAICSVELSHHITAGTGKGRGDQTWTCIDHCHTTNQVRGLLCTHCNQGIGSLRDDPELMEAAAMYIRNSRSQTV